jgi:hypothetical protein
MSQIKELLGMIKKHRDAEVTGVSVMYTWLGRQIQPCRSARALVSNTLASQTCLGFLRSVLRKVKPFYD